MIDRALDHAMIDRVLVGLAALLLFMRPAAADESLFKTHCGSCHPSARQVSARVTGTADERRSRLDAVLRKHRRAPPDAVREAVIAYLLTLPKP